MAPRYLKPGEDFNFDPAFGFTGSARGRHDATSHPADADDNEYGDGSFVESQPALAKEKARGGQVRRASGGTIEQERIGQIRKPAEDPRQYAPVAPSEYKAVDLPMREMYDKPEGMRRGGRAPRKPSPAHPYNDPKGYQIGGPAVPMPTGRPTGVPAMGAAPGVGPAAGPMVRAPAPMAPQASPLAQGAQGGPLSNATVTMPVHDASRLAHGLVQAGRVGGIRQAIGNAAAARGAAAARMQALSPGAAGSPVAAPPAPVAQQGVPAMAEGGHITAAQRHRLPASEFGLPAKEAYPLDTPGRARSALSRASANASPAEQATIRRKVHRLYPSIGKK